MDINESLSSLKELCRGKDWFHEAVIGEYDRLIVYVNSMSGAVITAVPDVVGGHQVLVHFASALTANKKDFIEDLATATTDPAPPPISSPVIDDEEDTMPIDLLIKELDKLERVCGSNVLGEIFFEEHDGTNAVTNLSVRYPEVRKKIHELYEIYGFDVIYDELEL